MNSPSHYHEPGNRPRRSVDLPHSPIHSLTLPLLSIEIEVIIPDVVPCEQAAPIALHSHTAQVEGAQSGTAHHVK